MRPQQAGYDPLFLHPLSQRIPGALVIPHHIVAVAAPQILPLSASLDATFHSTACYSNGTELFPGQADGRN